MCLRNRPEDCRPMEHGSLADRPPAICRVSVGLAPAQKLVGYSLLGLTARIKLEE